MAPKQTKKGGSPPKKKGVSPPKKKVASPPKKKVVTAKDPPAKKKEAPVEDVTPKDPPAKNKETPVQDLTPVDPPPEKSEKVGKKTAVEVAPIGETTTASPSKVPDASSGEDSGSEDESSSEEEETRGEKKGSEEEESSESGEEEEGESSSEEESSEEEEPRQRKAPPPSASSSSESDSESEEETEALPPEAMYLPQECYSTTVKIATWCYVSKAVDVINKMLDQNEKNWFVDHPQFKHFFHMPKDANHKTMGMLALLLRTARISKEKEAWFIVNGVPIRYSMSEHALISGLDCHDYPKDYDEIGDMKFVSKHFEGVKKVTLKVVEEKLLSMKRYSRDRLKMAVLYFLSSVMKGSTKRGTQATAVDKFFQRIVGDLDRCVSFPWGRYTFLDNLREIKKMMQSFEGGISAGSVNFPTFVIPLELLAFEAIPSLGLKFREVVPTAENGCPRMCKSVFKKGVMKGFSVEEINKELGETKDIQSILKPSGDEKDLLFDLMPQPGYEGDVADTIVDGWTKRLVDERRTICFDDLLAKDIKGRDEPPKIFEKKRKKRAIVAASTESVSSGFVPLDMFMEFKDSLEARWTDVVDRLDDMTARLSAVEVLANDTASKVNKSDDSWLGRVPATTIVLREPTVGGQGEKEKTADKPQDKTSAKDKGKAPCQSDESEDEDSEEDSEETPAEDVDKTKKRTHEGEEDVDKTKKRMKEGEEDVEKPKKKRTKKGYSDLTKGPYSRPKTRALEKRQNQP